MPKILVDTNILLRFLIDGDLELERIARRGIVWLLDEIIIELVFAMENHYLESRDFIFNVVTEILMKPYSESNRTRMLNSLIFYKNNEGLSIVDAYLIAVSQENNVELVTYDKKLARKVSK